jgi:hypothetical protein
VVRQGTRGAGSRGFRRSHATKPTDGIEKASIALLKEVQ